jgi:hypothetical protein
MRVGDWNCASCGFSNFQRRAECMQCSRSRTSTPRENSPARSNAQHKLTTPQPANGKVTFDHYQSAAKSSAVFDAAKNAHHPGPKMEKGLGDSLWAPRNFQGRSRKADTSQVWIRASLKPTNSALLRLIIALRGHSKTLTTRIYNHVGLRQIPLPLHPQISACHTKSSTTFSL